MKVAITGSRSLCADFLSTMLENIPIGCSEIISGGAAGADALAAACAEKLGVPLIVIAPDYEKSGRAAPLIRNAEIVEKADYVLVFWDGKSKGSRNVIMSCLKTLKPVKVVPVK